MKKAPLVIILKAGIDDGSQALGTGSVTAYNTTGVNNYYFTDTKPVTGVSYCRLKMMDVNGRFTYSKIEVINNKQHPDAAVQPNQVNRNFVLTYPMLRSAGKIRFLDAEGRKVKTMNALQNTNVITVDASARSPGIYLAEIASNSERYSVKFVKQ